MAHGPARASGTRSLGGAGHSPGAAAAGLAWFLAGLSPVHESPLFAPVAALVALGSSAGHRGRQAIEMVLGVAVGIAVADLLGRAVGSGAWQLAFISALAMLAALVLFQSPLFIGQAGVWALLVITVPEQGHLTSERFVDALVGGAVALLFAQVIFPLDPLRVVRGAARPVFDELAEALNGVADALERRDRDLAEEMADRVAALDHRVDSMEEAFGVGKSAARLSRTARRARPGLEPYAAAVDELGLAAGNVRVLAGAIARRLQEDVESPPDLVQAIRDLARAVRELAAEVEEHRGEHHSRRYAVEAARRARVVAEEAHDLTTMVIVHQVEWTAYDLLRGGGVESEPAHEAVSA